jgi:DNA-damage-inducible protein J
MSKTAMIRARVEPALKSEVEALLGRLGLTPTDAIRLFYTQVALHKGLPFSVRVPNAATRKAMREAEAGRTLETWTDLSALKASIR